MSPSLRRANEVGGVSGSDVAYETIGCGHRRPVNPLSQLSPAGGLAEVFNDAFAVVLVLAVQKDGGRGEGVKDN